MSQSTSRARSSAERPASRSVTWGASLALGLAALAGIAVACGDQEPEASGAGPADGAALYAANCAVCHGADLRGTAAGPSFLSIVYEPSHHPDESFFVAVREGVVAHHWDFGSMRPVPGLDDDEVSAIVRYVREVQEREGFEPYPPE